MEKNYQIKKLSSTDFKYVIISKNYHGIDDYLSDLTVDLKEKVFRGIVLFDCLLSNGYANRFLIANFNGKSFDFTTFQSINANNVDKDIFKILDQVYLQNIQWIENNMILSNAQKFLLKKKLISNPPTITALPKRKKQIH